MSFAVKYLPPRLRVTLRIGDLLPSDPVILVRPQAATHSSELLVDMVSCRYSGSINLVHFYNIYRKARHSRSGVSHSGDVLDHLYVEGYNEPLGMLLHTLDNRAIERLGQSWAKDLEKLMKLFPKGTRVTVRYKGAARSGDFHPNGTFSYAATGLTPAAFVEVVAGVEVNNPFDHIFVQIDETLDQSLSVVLQEEQKDTATATATATVSNEQRDTESGELKGLLNCAMPVQVRHKGATIHAILDIDGTFSYWEPSADVRIIKLHSSELIEHFNYQAQMGAAILPIVTDRSLDYIFFYRDGAKSLTDHVQEMYEQMPALIEIPKIPSGSVGGLGGSVGGSVGGLGGSVGGSVNATQATTQATTHATHATPFPSPSDSHPHQSDVTKEACLHVPDVIWIDKNSAPDYPKTNNVVVYPAPDTVVVHLNPPVLSSFVRTDEINRLKGIVCSPVRVHVRHNGLSMDAIFEPNGTFSCGHDTLIHSEELIWRFNERIARLDVNDMIVTLTPLDHIVYSHSSSNKSIAADLRELVSTPSPQQLLAKATAQQLLAKATARTAELQAELELWRQIVIQHKINKDLEHQLEQIKATLE